MGPGVGSDPPRCPIHSVSYSDSQGDSRARFQPSEREKGKERKVSRPAQARGESRVHSVLPHTFPFGVSASWASGDKADTPPRASTEGGGSRFGGQNPTSTLAEGWVKSLHFSELSFLIWKMGEEGGRSEE